MHLTYKHTRYAAYIGYVTQAVVNNFAPLLFVTFSNTFGLSLEQLSILITVNFGTQILIDLSSAGFLKRIGYRRACVWSHAAAALGLVFYGILPYIINPFAGLLIANVFCAIGGGMDEVVVSPIVEALPGDAKASSMALLHSFYSWGQVLVVAVSTLFFVIVGVEKWPVMAAVWALIPAFDAVLFAFVPIRELNEGAEDTPLRSLFGMGSFWLFLLIMVCSGASELAMSQWASLFAERGLGVNKALGDLLGPCAFAFLMGLTRVFYGIFGERMNLRKFLVGSGILCVISYLLAVFSPYPVLALIGCALCGLSVGLMWPGTYSLAAARFPAGGAAMFAILAFAGDIGCTSGPTLAGMIGDATGDIKKGLLAVAAFPLMLAFATALLRSKTEKNKAEFVMKGIKRLFGDKKFYAMVLGIAVPVMIQNSITNFVSLLDNIMVGRTGTEPMSGVSIVNTLLFVFNLCLFGAVSGVSIFSSQFYGQRDWEGLRHAFRLKFIICMAIGILAIILLIFAGETLINYYLMSGDNEGDAVATLAYGKEYLRVMLIGLLPFALSQVYASTLREMGDTKVPMIASVVAVATNLIFNYLLIFGKFGFPEMGVKGAAVATVISRFLEAVIVMLRTHLSREEYPFIVGVYKSLYVPGTLIKQVAIKGTPLLINETLWSAGVAMQNQCYSLRGLEVIAAMNIASTVTNLFSGIYLALGSSVGIIVGPLLGADETEEAKDTAAKMLTFSVMVGLVIGGIVFLISSIFPRFYNTSEDIRLLATSIIRIGACFMLVFAFENAAYFTLRTGGKTIITFLFDSFSMWVMVVPLAWVLSRFTDMNILMLYTCVNLLDIIKCTIGFILVKKGVWINNIVKDMK